VSAYVVDDRTIHRIVTRLSFREALDLAAAAGTRADDAALGRALFDLNVRAVDARYGAGEAATFRDLDYRHRPELCSDVQALKSLRCLLYQCSEGDVPETPLYKALDELSHAWALEIVEALPAWAAAQWE
jgi:hypothetical protein